MENECFYDLFRVNTWQDSSFNNLFKVWRESTYGVIPMTGLKIYLEDYAKQDWLHTETTFSLNCDNIEITVYQIVLLNNVLWEWPEDIECTVYGQYSNMESC